MEELVQSFKALGNKNRLQIIELLMEKEYSCYRNADGDECSLDKPACDFGELIELLGIHKSTLSHHLKELRYAGLIETRKDGRYISVVVNRERIKELNEFFELEEARQKV